MMIVIVTRISISVKPRLSFENFIMGYLFLLGSFE